MTLHVLERVANRSLSRTDDDTIAVSVGSQRKRFLVHELLVRDTVPFFDAAFKGRWKGSKERKSDLPEDNPDIFKIYLHWLYTGKLLTKKGDDKRVDRLESGTKRSTYPKWNRLSDLYRLANRLLDDDAKDCVDAMLELERERDVIYAHWATLAYPLSIDGSPVRRLLIVRCVYGTRDAWNVLKAANSLTISKRI